MTDRRFYAIVGVTLTVALTILVWSTLAVADDFSVAFTEGAAAATQAERRPSVQVTPVPVAPTTPPAITHGPGGTTVEGRCTQYEPLLAEHSPGWSVATMSKIMWRESRCTPGVVSNTGCCWSLLQLDVRLHLRDHRTRPLYHECGVFSLADADGPEDVERHVCAAAALWSVVGSQAWAL